VNKKEIFNKLISINKKIYQIDDTDNADNMIDEDVLFELQQEMSEFLLVFATEIKQEERLIKEFPFLYDCNID
jgi:regulator of sigma D